MKTMYITNKLNALYGGNIHIQLDYLYNPNYIKINIIQSFNAVSYLPFELTYCGNLYKINIE